MSCVKTAQSLSTRERFGVEVEPGEFDFMPAEGGHKSHHRQRRVSTPIVFDCGCLEEYVALRMVINGQVRPSCTALIDEYAPRMATRRHSPWENSSET